MEINLKDINMELGIQYEGIITTISSEGKSNTGPFAIFCKEEDKIMCRIFKGSTTLENILSEREFVVNITNNALMYTLALINTIPEKYISRIKTENNKELAILNDCEAYFKVKVTKATEGSREDNLSKSDLYFIDGSVTEIVKNQNDVRPMNRGIHALMDALVNYSRIELADKELQEEYIKRFKESERIITKVGFKEEKESIKILKEDLKRKNYKIN